MRKHWQFFSSIIALLCLSACSSPTIYLNDYDLTQDNFRRVKTELEDHGYVVESVSVQPPDTITESTIITGPRPTVLDNFRGLYDILEKLGYPNMAIQAIESGNHWYRGDNIGLYLFDQGARTEHRRMVIGTYTSKACTSQLTMTLNESSTVEITSDEGLRITGNWSIQSMPYIHLTSDTTYLHYYFEIIVAESTRTSAAPGHIRLVPLEGQSKLLNCSFSSI